MKGRTILKRVLLTVGIVVPLLGCLVLWAAVEAVYERGHVDRNAAQSFRELFLAATGTDAAEGRLRESAYGALCQDSTLALIREGEGGEPAFLDAKSRGTVVLIYSRSACQSCLMEELAEAVKLSREKHQGLALRLLVREALNPVLSRTLRHMEVTFPVWQDSEGVWQKALGTEGPLVVLPLDPEGRIRQAYLPQVSFPDRRRLFWGQVHRFALSG